MNLNYAHLVHSWHGNANPTVVQKYIDTFFKIRYHIFEIRFPRVSINSKFPKIDFAVLFTVVLCGN